jgi:hypothetical protein
MQERSRGQTEAPSPASGQRVVSKAQLDDWLDDALADTFPASDPIASPPSEPPSDGGHSARSHSSGPEVRS